MHLNIEPAIGLDIGTFVLHHEMVDTRRVRELERRHGAQLVGGGCDGEKAALRDHDALDLGLTRIERGDAERRVDAARAEDEHVGKDVSRFANGLGAEVGALGLIV